MHAVLLAGGKGSRQYPLTSGLPKPLLPLAGISVIDRLIGQLCQSGVDEITVATGYMAGRVQNHLGSGRAYGVPFRYFEEMRPLGTAGCLGHIESRSGDFLLVNADIVTDFPFDELFDTHRRLDATATIAVRRHRLTLDFNVLETDDEGNLQDYTQKPDVDFWVGMGIYCFSPRVCEFVEPNESVSVAHLLLRLRDAGEVVRSYRADCSWFDIGHPENYARAEQYCRAMTPRSALRRAA